MSLSRRMAEGKVCKCPAPKSELGGMPGQRSLVVPSLWQAVLQTCRLGVGEAALWEGLSCLHVFLPLLLAAEQPSPPLSQDRMESLILGHGVPSLHLGSRGAAAKLQQHCRIVLWVRTGGHWSEFLGDFFFFFWHFQTFWKCLVLGNFKHVPSGTHHAIAPSQPQGSGAGLGGGLRTLKGASGQMQWGRCGTWAGRVNLQEPEQLLAQPAAQLCPENAAAATGMMSCLWQAAAMVAWRAALNSVAESWHVASLFLNLLLSISVFL